MVSMALHEVAVCQWQGSACVPHRAMVRSCMLSKLRVKSRRMRSMSESHPAAKSSHGGKFLKADMWKLSERVKARKGRQCLDAGRNRRLPAKWTTVPSLMVSPYALFTVSA